MSLARSVYKRKSHCLEILGQLKVRKSYFWPLQIINFTLKLLLLRDDQEVSFPHWLIKITFLTVNAFCVFYAMFCFLFVLEHALSSAVQIQEGGDVE